MYDEQVKRLRELQAITEHCDEQSCDECENRELCDKYDNKTLSRTYKEAADAIEELICEVADEHNARLDAEERQRWIPVTERLPSDFVSVQAHITDAGNFPSVREAYVINKNWFFPALKEFLPVDMWKRFDEPPNEET